MNNLVDIFCRLLVAIDLLLLLLGEFCCHETGVSGEGTELFRGEVSSWNSLVANNGGAERLCEH
jgi:hypothetical protein